MFYLYEEEFDLWQNANNVYFPDGTTLSVDNKEEKGGWKWYDTPPTEYNKWLEQQQNI
jgi:hypothetical protein